MILWGTSVDPAGAPPFALVLVLMGMPAVVIAASYWHCSRESRRLERGRKTMRDNSEKRRKKVAPLLCAAVVVVFLGLFLGALLLPLLDVGSGDGGAVVILILYALVLLAVIVGVVIALIQRLREIERGEEEDARKY